MSDQQPQPKSAMEETFGMDTWVDGETWNGRLAMLGIFSLLSEQKVPGAVPFLSGKIPTLPDMEIMGPFVGTDGISHIW